MEQINLFSNYKYQFCLDKNEEIKEIGCKNALKTLLTHFLYYFFICENMEKQFYPFYDIK